jgi:hypothetical protein
MSEAVYSRPLSFQRVLVAIFRKFLAPSFKIDYIRSIVYITFGKLKVTVELYIYNSYIYTCKCMYVYIYKHITNVICPVLASFMTGSEKLVRIVK